MKGISTGHLKIEDSQFPMVTYACHKTCAGTLLQCSLFCLSRANKVKTPVEWAGAAGQGDPAEEEREVWNFPHSWDLAWEEIPRLENVPVTPKVDKMWITFCPTKWCLGYSISCKTKIRTRVFCDLILVSLENLSTGINSPKYCSELGIPLRKTTISSLWIITRVFLYALRKVTFFSK